VKNNWEGYRNRESRWNMGVISGKAYWAK